MDIAQTIATVLAAVAAAVALYFAWRTVDESKKLRREGLAKPVLAAPAKKTKTPGLRGLPRWAVLGSNQ